MLAAGKTIEKATEKLQRATDNNNKWKTNWRITLNENKSVCVNYAYKIKDNYQSEKINQSILHVNIPKYLGMNLHAELRWRYIETFEF